MRKKKNLFVLVNEGPEVVGMISSVLEGNGSVDTAIRRLASEGPSSSRHLFRGIVDDADLRIDSDMENATYRMLSGLPEQCSSYSMAVRMALSGSRTSDCSERTRILKEAADISLNGLKDVGKSFSSSLNTPCMMIFGIGIMVPMILMSILPMMGVGGLFSSVSTDSRSIAVLTLVIIPSAVLAIISGIHSRNPLKMDPQEADPWTVLALSASIPVFAVLFATGSDFSDSLCISMIAGCLASLAVSGIRNSAVSQKAIVGTALENSLFEIGNRLLAGGSFETSVELTLRTRSRCSFLAPRFINGITANRGDVIMTIEETFGPYSHSFSNILAEVYTFSEKDPRDAGRLAMSLAHRNEDRENLRRNIRHDLKNMTDTMFGTASVFAPLVLGLSVSMMEPMKVLSDSIDTAGTSAILSVYLCELCLVISVLLAMIDGGCSAKNIVRRFTMMLPISLTVFLVAMSL